jgi:hypothetical protein
MVCHGVTVSLLSPQQKVVFDYYLLSDYRRYRSDLVAIGKIVYQQVKIALGKANPDRADCLGVLTNALLNYQRFTHILNSKQHLKWAMRMFLAEIAARYLLEADWIDIAF